MKCEKNKKVFSEDEHGVKNSIIRTIGVSHTAISKMNFDEHFEFSDLTGRRVYVNMFHM